MGQWEQLPESTRQEVTCEIPDCTNMSYICFLPAFEGPGGWCGPEQEYASDLDIAYICATHFEDV